MRYPKLAAALAVTGSMFLSAQLQADTYLSIGSNPVGNTAYQWAAGISEVVNKNVDGSINNIVNKDVSREPDFRYTTILLKKNKEMSRKCQLRTQL